MNKKYLILTVAALLFANNSKSMDGSSAPTTHSASRNTSVDLSDLSLADLLSDEALKKAADEENTAHLRLGEGYKKLTFDFRNQENTIREREQMVQAGGIGFATYLVHDLAKKTGNEKAIRISEFALQSAATNVLARGVNGEQYGAQYLPLKFKYENLGNNMKSYGSAAAVEAASHLITQTGYGKCLNRKYDEFFESYNIETFGKLGKQGVKALATLQVAFLLDSAERWAKSKK